MKSIFALVSAFVLFSAFSVSAQTVAPTATPTPRPPGREDVVIISTQLIQIDATVTDKDGKVVKGLTKDDFEIYENDEMQDISAFSFVDLITGRDAVVEKKGKNSKTEFPDPISSTTLRPEDVRRTIALVVDDLGLSFSSIFYIKSSLKKFVDEQMQPGDLVAIIRTGGGIGVLQQFTADKNILYASIDRLRFNMNSRTGLTSFAPIEPSFKEVINASMNPVGSGQEDLNTFTLGTQEDLAADLAFKEFRAGGFAVGSLGALSYVVRGMSALPGRKAVALLSEGFALYEPDGGINPRLGTALKNFTDLAIRTGVVVYTIDPRGLVAPGMTGEDSVVGLRDDPFVVGNKLRQREKALEDSQQSLQNLARETGGDAYLNQNDISKGIERVLDKQSGYYLIGYQPQDDTFDPKVRKFNKLTVKLKRPGLKLNYRSGFFGVADADVKPQPKSSLQKVADALNSPFVKNEIELRMHAIFVNGEKFPSMRSFLHVKGDQITFTKEPSGEYKAGFNVLVLLFDENGTISDKVDRVESIKLKADAYKEISEQGLVYSLFVPIKKPGAYQMRMAIQDQATQKIGSVSQFVLVPDLKKKKLVVSGIALQNNREFGTGINLVQTNERREITLRQFKAGSELRFGFAVYNALIDRATDQPKLSCRIRVFRDGQEIFRGQEIKVSSSDKTDPKAANISGTFGLGSGLPPGDYVLQVIVKDELKSLKEFTVQNVDFEIVR
ncbi:MAG: VWA domain-containing protein [Pyrinomonadaceae bacterium]|nr:VWA domain-containing protein [Pyrinomonadaceae bacterium]MBP6213014.1 VWA domain-containing protein [Pyrinomonadaceae bacterium]